MNEEENFDQTLKEKLESRTYTPSESSWAAAEKLIAAQRQTRVRKTGLFSFAAVAGIGLIAAGSWFFTHADNATTNSAAKQSPNTVAAEKQMAENNAPQNINGKTNTLSNQKTNGSSETDGNNTGTAQQPGINTAGNQQYNKDQNNNTPGKQQTGNNTAAKTGNKKGAGAKTNGVVNGAKKQTPENVVAVVTDKGPKSETESGAETTTETEVPFDNDPRRIDDIITSIETAEALKNTTTDKTTPAGNGNTSDSSRTENQLLATVTPILTGKTAEDLNQEKEKTGSAVTSGSSTSNPAVLPSNGYWFTRGGVAYMPGFHAATGSGRSINPVIGGGYSYGFGGRFRMEGGLQYTTINHASDSSRIYTSVNYGFGLEQARTEIGLQRLHYIAMPVQLRIGINAKNALLVGVTPHYLFTTESRVRTYNQSRNLITNDKTERAFGYGQGLRTYDFLLSGGYTRTISDHFEIMGVFNFGLMDIKDNTYFGFDKSERHKNLQLILHYTF